MEEGGREEGRATPKEPRERECALQGCANGQEFAVELEPLSVITADLCGSEWRTAASLVVDLKTIQYLPFLTAQSKGTAVGRRGVEYGLTSHWLRQTT